MSSKAGKIALAIAVLVVAGLVYMRTTGGAPDAGLPKDFGFVCVVTGEVFDMDIDDVLSIPAKNPKTGERTLLPCKPDENGVMRVLEFYRAPLMGDLKDVNKFVDPASLEVKKSG